MFASVSVFFWSACFSISIAYTFDNNLVNNKKVQLTIMKRKSCDHEEVEILNMKTIDKCKTLSDYISYSNVMWALKV